MSLGHHRSSSNKNNNQASNSNAEGLALSLSPVLELVRRRNPHVHLLAHPLREQSLHSMT